MGVVDDDAVVAGGGETQRHGEAVVAVRVEHGRRCRWRVVAVVAQGVVARLNAVAQLAQLLAQCLEAVALLEAQRGNAGERKRHPQQAQRDGEGGHDVGRGSHVAAVA